MGIEMDIGYPVKIAIGGLDTPMPQWMLNFFESLPVTADADLVNSELSKYRARYAREKYVLTITFDSEQDYAWFVIKWT